MKLNQNLFISCTVVKLLSSIFLPVGLKIHAIYYSGKFNLRFYLEKKNVFIFNCFNDKENITLAGTVSPCLFDNGSF